MAKPGLEARPAVRVPERPPAGARSARAATRDATLEAAERENEALHRANTALRAQLASRTTERDDVQRLLDRLLVTAPVSLWIVDRIENRIVYSRDQNRLLGRDAKSSIGRDSVRRMASIHPDDRPAFERAWARAALAGDGEIVEWECRHQHADGSWRWLHDQATVFSRTPEGAVETTLGVSIDITERKRSEAERSRVAHEAVLASDRERRALAVSLHDGVGQLLPLLRTKFALLRARQGEAVEEPLWRELDQLILDAHRDAVALARALSPAPLSEQGLPEALRWLADDLAQRHGFELQLVDRAGSARLSRALEITLFRSVRELLLEIVRRAAVQRARVELSRGDGLLRIAIEDRSMPLDPASKAAELGLAHAREQLAYLGGFLRVKARSGGGAIVTLVAPLAVEAGADLSGDGGAA